MEGLLLSLRVVFPMCALMVLGYGMKHLMKLSDITLQQINKMIFNVFLPIVLCLNIYNSDLAADASPRYLAFGAAATLVSFVIIYVLAKRVVKEKSDAATIAQGTYRSNNVLFGLTIVTALYPESESLGKVSLLAALAVFIYSITVVFLFETYRDGKIKWGKVFIGIIKNPLMIGILVGFVLLITGIKLPGIVASTLSDIGAITTPLALIVLGGTFTFAGFAKYKKQLLGCALGKLVVIPAFVLVFAVMLGFRGEDLAAYMSLFASPTAVSSFAMADQMGGNGELAALIIVATSVLSLLTLFGWIYLFNMLGYI